MFLRSISGVVCVNGRSVFNINRRERGKQERGWGCGSVVLPPLSAKERALSVVQLLPDRSVRRGGSVCVLRSSSSVTVK